ncbi:recombinase XerD [Clostridia bacterium]|nr:recombinase XerD [Clostridia bacterium]
MPQNASDYYAQRDEMNYKRFQGVLGGLPEFCEEFFLGIKQHTSMLTRLNYAYDLKAFFTFLTVAVREFKGRAVTDFKIADLNAVTVTHLEKYLEYLEFYEINGKKLSCGERARSRKLACVKTMCKYFFNKEKLAADHSSKLKLPKLHDKEIIRLEVDEIARLLNEAESGAALSDTQKVYHRKTKKRDLAMLTLFLGTGIRISECVGLNVDDIDFQINGFRVTRKGGSKVILYFSDEVAACLKEYLDGRAQSDGERKAKNPKYTRNDALFLSLQEKRMSVRAVQELVKKYARIISPLKKITPHKLRSTYGTALYKETHDIYVVADVLGHKDVNTTKKHYAALSDDVRRAAANKVKLRD